MRNKLILLLGLLVIIYPFKVIGECREIRPYVEKEKKKIEYLSKKELIEIIKTTKNSAIFSRIAACEIIVEKGDVEDINEIREIAEDLSFKNIRNKKSKYVSDGKKDGNIIGSIPDYDLELGTCMDESVAKIMIRSRCSDENDIKCIFEFYESVINTNDILLLRGLDSLLKNKKYSEIDLKYLMDRKRDNLIDVLLIEIAERNYNPLLYNRLVEIIRDQNWGMKVNAIRILEKVGDKSIIPILKELYNNSKEHKKVREAAKEAIEKLSK